MEFRDSLENAVVGMKDIELDSLDAINRELEGLAIRKGVSDEDFQRACGDLRARIGYLKTINREARSREVSNSFTIDEMETRLKEIEAFRRHEQRRFRLLAPTPTNAQIDMEERHSHHFAQGITFYKLFWIFFIGSFLGVVIEMIWVVVIHGHFETRSGLIYGPFNMVYGFGAAVLSAALYRFRNWSKLFSFLGGFIAGSAVEYACSLFQEMVFGSTSWDYSNLPFNLNGRICLLYSLFWGALGVVWIKGVYPRMSRWILKIPNRVGKALTWVLLVFMVFNGMMSSFAVLRWGARIQGAAPATRLDAYLDEHYPDERMEKIYAGMTFTIAGQEHDDSRFAR